MERINAALQIIVGLGAYCPRVKLSSEEKLGIEAMKAGHHKRPLIGRGGYGETLRAHFNKKRLETMQKKVEA